MHKIDSYQFGEISINGTRYTTDVIILDDRIISDRWRKEGHELSCEDIADVLEEKLQVLVVGSGVYDMMKVMPDVEETARTRDIELIVETTDNACDTYNRLSDSRTTAAVLHITC